MGQLDAGVSRRGNVATARRAQAPTVVVVEPAAIDIARGLLLLLAILPVAAIAAPSFASASRAMAIFAAFGELTALPACLFMAGFVWRPLPAASAARQWLAPAVAAILIAASWAALGRDWRAGLSEALPLLRLLVLPAAYGLLMRPFARASRKNVLALACASHVAAVIGGGKAVFWGAPFVFFAAGVFAQAYGPALSGFAREEPEMSAAVAPIALALALIALGLAPRDAATLSVAQIGPAVLIVGLGAGVSLLISGVALSRSGLADVIGDFGRSFPGVLALWIPLAALGAAVMRDDMAARPANLALLGLASLAAAYLALELLRLLHNGLKSAAHFARLRFRS